MDPDRSIDAAAKRSLVIGQMIASLKRGEYRDYFVSLVGYFIEGIPYSASGFGVDASATPDITQTDGGFSCTAFFPPNLLQPSTVKKNGVIKRRFGADSKETVKVRVEVKLHDIWAVSEHIGGVQHDLFRDAETFGS